MSNPIKRIRILPGRSPDELVFGVSVFLCAIRDDVSITGWFTDQIFAGYVQTNSFNSGLRIVGDTLFKEPKGFTGMYVRTYELALKKANVFDWDELVPEVLTAIYQGLFPNDNPFEVEVQDHTGASPTTAPLSTRIKGK